jgi:hypothetical protein
MLAFAVPAANTPPLVAVTVIVSVCVVPTGLVAFCGVIWMNASTTFNRSPGPSRCRTGSGCSVAQVLGWNSTARRRRHLHESVASTVLGRQTRDRVSLALLAVNGCVQPPFGELHLTLPVGAGCPARDDTVKVVLASPPHRCHRVARCGYRSSS